MGFPYRAAELLPWTRRRWPSLLVFSSLVARTWRSGVLFPEVLERLSSRLSEEGSVLREVKVRWTVSGLLSMLDRCPGASRGLSFRMLEVSFV